MVGHRSCFVALVLLFAVSSAVTAEDYKTSYGKAIGKIDKGKWGEAEQLLRSAIADNPSATTKKMRIYGNRVKPYLPYYHLGLALFEQGDCAGAMQAWSTAEQHGAVNAFDREYGRLAEAREQCRQQMPKPTATSPPRPTKTPMPRPTPTPSIDLKELGVATDKARVELDRADGAAGDLKRRTGDPAYGEALRSMPDAARREADASAALEKARRAFDAGVANQDFASLDQAFQLAAQARKSFETATGAIDSKMSELAASAAEKQAMDNARRKLYDEIEARLPAAENALAGDRELSRESLRGIGAEKSALEQLVGEAQRIRSSSLSISQLQQLSRDLQQGAGSYRRTVAAQQQAEQRAAAATKAVVPTEVVAEQATAVPAAEIQVGDLREAAAALLNADYDGVLSRFEDLGPGQGRSFAVAHLIRSAARYALFRLGGEQDQELLAAARRDVGQCREADISVSPVEPYFGPSFVAFFSGS